MDFQLELVPTDGAMNTYDTHSFSILIFISFQGVKQEDVLCKSSPWQKGSSETAPEMIILTLYHIQGFRCAL